LTAALSRGSIPGWIVVIRHLADAASDIEAWRTGDKGCGGVSVSMDRIDAAVIHHLEHRLLEPKRLDTMMDSIVDRRDAFIHRRGKHIADLRKCATEAEAKLQRLYQVIESGMADPNDRSLKARINELRKRATA
jgi:site-specific DNA recombinase